MAPDDEFWKESSWKKEKNKKRLNERDIVAGI